MSYKFSAIIEKEENWYVALCPEVDVVSQGKTIEEALVNLKEALELYLETAGKDELATIKQSPFITTLEVAV